MKLLLTKPWAEAQNLKGSSGSLPAQVMDGPTAPNLRTHKKPLRGAPKAPTISANGTGISQFAASLPVPMAARATPKQAASRAEPRDRVVLSRR